MSFYAVWFHIYAAWRWLYFWHIDLFSVVTDWTVHLLLSFTRSSGCLFFLEKNNYICVEEERKGSILLRIMWQINYEQGIDQAHNWKECSHYIFNNWSFFQLMDYIWYLWMLGINPYKLVLTVKGYECGQRQKTPKTQNPPREEKKGGKGFFKLKKLVTVWVRKVAKIFSAGCDLLWSTIMVFIGGRCTLSKIDMHDTDLKNKTCW